MSLSAAAPAVVPGGALAAGLLRSEGRGRRGQRDARRRGWFHRQGRPQRPADPCHPRDLRKTGDQGPSAGTRHEALIFPATLVLPRGGLRYSGNLIIR